MCNADNLPRHTVLLSHGNAAQPSQTAGLCQVLPERCSQQSRPTSTAKPLNPEPLEDAGKILVPSPPDLLDLTKKASRPVAPATRQYLQLSSPPSSCRTGDTILSTCPVFGEHYT
jgi:hypothetical protein